MLWVALYYPTLSLDRIQRRLPDGLAPAFAVHDSKASQRWIAMANERACEAGVAVGQTVATALALHAELILAPRDVEDELEALRECALALLRFTPSVSVQSQGILLEISASVRLFGGRRRLLKKISETSRALKLHAAMGVAPHAHAAWLFALTTAPGTCQWADRNHVASTLSKLPLACLASATDHLATLRGIGCHTIADLVRLPRTGMARRFGAALLDEIDQAYGRMARVYAWFSAPEHFESRLELIARVDTVEALLFATQRLVVQLGGWLTARHCAVGALTLTLHHEVSRKADTATTTVVVRLAQPSMEPGHLSSLWRERLGRLELVAPVHELTLGASEIHPAQRVTHELFPTPQSHAVTLNRLIEKITARLGSDAIGRLRSVADHRPEKAWAQAHTDALSGAAQVPLQAARPTWLLPIPLPLNLSNHRPVYASMLSLLAGPERIESGWWDDAMVARDYYIAKNQEGQLLWIFRERKHMEQPRAWFLHGMFA